MWLNTILTRLTPGPRSVQRRGRSVNRGPLISLAFRPVCKVNAFRTDDTP